MGAFPGRLRALQASNPKYLSFYKQQKENASIPLSTRLPKRLGGGHGEALQRNSYAPKTFLDVHIWELSS